MKILFADDDAELRFIIARMLRKEGYTVMELADSDSLRISLKTYSKEYKNDREKSVLVTDVYMPGGTSLEIVNELKEHLQDLDIIFITSARDPQITEQGLTLGARAVLSKPVDMNELKGILRKIFREKSRPRRVDLPRGAD